MSQVLESCGVMSEHLDLDCRYDGAFVLLRLVDLIFWFGHLCDL